MYLCLCKGLTEEDIRELAAVLARSNVTSIEAFLKFLDLDNIEACGLCAEDPEPFIELARHEWAAVHATDEGLEKDHTSS